MREKSVRCIVALAGWALVSLCACSGPSARADYDIAVDFAAFDSYAWLHFASEDERVNALDATIRSAIADELAAKGLREAAGSEPELLVRYRVTVEDEVRLRDPYYAFQEVERYEVGTLVIELLDATTRSTLWTGSGRTHLQDSPSVEEREERARRAVQEVLALYPPPHETADG